MLDKTKNYKIDVSALSTAERTKLQEELFKMGYYWYGSKPHKVDINAEYLMLYSDKEITLCDIGFFGQSTFTLLTVSDILPPTIELPTISLRDYFAGLALSGFTVGLGGYLLKEEYSAYINGACNSSIANRCYAIADAMIKERNK